MPCLVWAGLIAGWETPFWSFVFDDSFYYWQIARHLAAGHGSTFDGLHSTNGYHPLWMGICTLVYGLGLGESAPRITMLLQVGLFALSWLLLGGALRRLIRHHPHAADGSVLIPFIPLALGATALMHPLARVWINGLESSVCLLFQVALLRVAAHGDLLGPDARRARVVSGLLIAGAFLARTDAALLLPSIALWSIPTLIRQPRQTAMALVEWLLAPSIVVLGYMALNQSLFGSAIQVSGLLKQAPLDWWRLVGATVLLALVCCAPRGLSAERFPRTSLLINRMGFMGLFAVSLCAYYGLLQRFPRLWYFGPAVLFSLLIGICFLMDLFARAVEERPDRTPGAAVRPLVVLFSLVGAGAICLGFWQAATAPNAAPLWANRSAGRHIASHLDPDTVLASWDAGVVGFYARRPVVNLDGVVSSVDYLRALQNGNTAAYLSQVPIRWVVNHAEQTVGEADLRRRARLRLGPRADRMRLVKTWPFSVFGGVNRALPSARVNRMKVFLFELQVLEE